MANATPEEMVEIDGVLFQPDEAPKKRSGEKESAPPANKAAPRPANKANKEG